MKTSVRQVTIVKVDGTPSEQVDLLAVEEPLEIRLGHGPADHRQQSNISVTMRTPGHDFELALGFLFSEGIIHQPEEIESIRYCQNMAKQQSRQSPEHPQSRDKRESPESRNRSAHQQGRENRESRPIEDHQQNRENRENRENKESREGPESRENIVRVELAAHVQVDLQRLQRNFFTSSSCGVCGKSSIEAIAAICPQPLSAPFSIAEEHIHRAPEILSKAQLVFKHTGGLHAAGLFNREGELLLWREDVGRHNALDKLIGACFMQQSLPLQHAFVLLSGRVSFELVQKALMSGISVLAAVGAPSSLAVELARQYEMTLLGFVRDQRFNIYSGYTGQGYRHLSMPD